MNINNIDKRTFNLSVNACPFCSSSNIIKHGKLKKHQRYICKTCKKTFVSTFRTYAYRSKIFSYKIRMIEKCFDNSLTIRATASISNVNKNTVLLWYKRFLHMNNYKVESKQLCDEVSIDETYINVPINNRTFKQNGQKYRGLSKNKITLAIGVDNCRNLRIGEIGRGHPSEKDLYDYWKDKIKEGSQVTHDSMKEYTSIIEKNKLTEIVVNTKDKYYAFKQMQRINNACSFLKHYLMCHKGIQNKNLYLHLKFVETRWSQMKMNSKKKIAQNFGKYIYDVFYLTRNELFKRISTLW